MLSALTVAKADTLGGGVQGIIKTMAETTDGNITATVEETTVDTINAITKLQLLIVERLAKTPGSSKRRHRALPRLHHLNPRQLR